MRIFPSWSTVMNEKVGSMVRLTTSNVQPVSRINRVPVRQRSPTERIYGQREMGAANGVDVDDIAEVANVRENEIFLSGGSRSNRFFGRHASIPAFRACSSSFARFCTQPVTAVSAGPPLGGLYLKPPSSGGLCEGVMTMPSAK